MRSIGFLIAMKSPMVSPQRLLGKSEKDRVGSGPYEYVRLKVFQGYSLGDPYDRDGERQQGRYFSNIRGELWMNFNPYLSFRGEAEFNPYRWDFEYPGWLSQGKGSERTIRFRSNIASPRIRSSNSIFIRRSKPLIPSIFMGAIRYNLLDKWRVETDYGAVYQSQCWSLGLLVENINKTPTGTQKRELKVQVFVTLLGIGSLGHIPHLMGLVMPSSSFRIRREGRRMNP